MPPTKNPGTLGKRFNKPENLLVRRTRAANFILDSVNGMNQKEIAAKYGVSVATVKNEILWAERDGMFEKAQSAITNRLIPLAMDVMEKALKKHLESGDYEAAQGLLEKAGVYAAVGRTQTVESDDNEKDELSFEQFLKKRLQAAPEPVLISVTPVQEGELVGTTQKQSELGDPSGVLVPYRGSQDHGGLKGPDENDFGG